MAAATGPGFAGEFIALPFTGALLSRHPAHSSRLRELFAAAPHELPAGTASASLLLSEVAELVHELPLQMLPPDIRRCVDSRRLAFVAGRLCAEHALLRLQGRALFVARGAMGEPVWPLGMNGSITHTDTTAVAAVGRWAGQLSLGIDSERCVSDEVMPDILNVCCTPSERQRLFGGSNDKLAATIVFSAKESLYKAIHATVRRVVDFDEAEVADIDWSRQQVRLGANPCKPHAMEIPTCVADFRVRGSEVHTSVCVASA